MQDLHLHLSGATSPVVLFELIKESGYKFRHNDYWDFERQVLLNKSNVKDLASYLDILHTIDKAQSSPLAIKHSVYNAFASSYLAGCRYLELRFNPTKRSQEGAIDLDSIIVAARAGMEKAESIFGITGGLILCMGRDVSVEANKAIFKKAKQYLGKGVLGVDIAGPYARPSHNDKSTFTQFVVSSYSVHGCERLYAEARELGMITTIHCGEEFHSASEEELSYVLNVLKPSRIGHGIQIHRYPELMEKARAFATHFEICISSNLSTGVIASKQDFKKIFNIFKSYHIDYSINTDATFLLNTNIRMENKLYEEILAMSESS